MNHWGIERFVPGSRIASRALLMACARGWWTRAFPATSHSPHAGPAPTGNALADHLSALPQLAKMSSVAFVIAVLRDVGGGTDEPAFGRCVMSGAESDREGPASTGAPASGGRLAGLRLCSFESRKQAEMQSLIERLGGHAVVAPSMREIPLEQNAAALTFGDRLRTGGVDVMVFLTGVGARALAEVLALQMTLPQLVDALRDCVVVVRGPKPAVVMREWGVRIDVQVPEPNTWRELLDAIARHGSVAGRVVAVQEYGIPNPDLYQGLQELGAQVVPVPVYRWELPEDTQPLRKAIRGIVAGDYDVLLFTSAQQWRHVEQVAREEVGDEAFLAAARKCVIASIGPTASETLLAAGLPPDIEPAHPKMGHLVVAVAEQARGLVAEKRARG